MYQSQASSCLNCRQGTELVPLLGKREDLETGVAEKTKSEEERSRRLDSCLGKTDAEQVTSKRPILRIVKAIPNESILPLFVVCL